MLEPRPEMRTATRFLAIASPGKVKAPGKADVRHPGFQRNHVAKPRHALAGVGPRLDRRLGARRIEYDHHADPAVEGAQHLRLCDAAGGSEPAEHRQRVDAPEIKLDAKSIWNDARDVVGKAAAGDVCERLHGATRADRSEA